VPKPEDQVRSFAHRGRWSLMVLSSYTFLGWAYVAANSVTHPQTLALQLTHFSRWPHEGTFALACFAVSAACFFLSQMVPDEHR
jgi:hypothetical protein